MNQLKPYLLWIVAGFFFLVLVILLAFVSPTVEDNGESKDAYQIKETLDAESKKLAALSKRARNGDPLGPFDPQLDSDIKKLTTDYLLTDRWLEVIEPHVKRYSEQLGQIRDDLLMRSKTLIEPVAPTSDRLQWYTPYQKLTGELVAKMQSAGCLEIPTETRMSFQPAVGPGGAAPAAAASEELDPEKSSKLRSILGLFTSEGDLPEADQHPVLTARFRIAERIASAVLGSAAESLPNPVLPGSGGTREPAAVSGWEWKQDNEPLEQPISLYAQPIRFKVTLQGSESALALALARIESLDRPVLIVLGSTLSRIDRLSAGARKMQGPKGEPRVAKAQMDIEILVLDFNQMPELQAGIATGPASTGPVGPMPMSAPAPMPVSSGPPPPRRGPTTDEGGD